MLRSVLRFIPRSLAGRLNILAKGPLVEDGWFESYTKKRPVDNAGHPLPWLTYPCIEFLIDRTLPTFEVFEYGAGYGTLWWASRSANITAVESNADWYDTIRKELPHNATVIHISHETEEYENSIAHCDQEFDIVVIDGRNRTKCTAAAIKHLKPEGVVLLDNSNRPKYKEAIQLLKEQGFKQLRFVGLSPGVNMKSETSIFYRQNNVLAI